MNLLWILVIAVLVVVVLYFFLRLQTRQARNLKELEPYQLQTATAPNSATSLQNRRGASVNVEPGKPPAVAMFGEMTAEDRIRLAVGAVANMAYVIDNDPADVKRVLYGVFRAALETVNQDPRRTFLQALGDHLHNVRNVGGGGLAENLKVALVYGKNSIFTLTDFSIVGRPYGLALSVAYLFSSIAHTLDAANQHRLQIATLLIAHLICEGMIGIENQFQAYVAVQLSETIDEPSPNAISAINDSLCRVGV